MNVGLDTATYLIILYIIIMGVVAFICFVCGGIGGMELKTQKQIFFSCVLISIIIPILIVSNALYVMTKDEYHKGYNDYPNNTTYDKIKSIETPTNEMKNYLHGWESAKTEHELNESRHVEKIKIEEINKEIKR